MFDIHHLLMVNSLIAAGECLAFLLSHWLIHGGCPPTEGPHLLTTPLVTSVGGDKQSVTSWKGLFLLLLLLFSLCK